MASKPTSSWVFLEPAKIATHGIHSLSLTFVLVVGPFGRHHADPYPAPLGCVPGPRPNPLIPESDGRMLLQNPSPLEPLPMPL